MEERRGAAALGVDADEAHVVPHLGQQAVEVELHAHRDDDGVRLPRQLVHLLDRDGVDLVVRVEAPDVLSVPLDHVDHLVL